MEVAARLKASNTDVGASKEKELDDVKKHPSSFHPSSFILHTYQVKEPVGLQQQLEFVQQRVEQVENSQKAS